MSAIPSVPGAPAAPPASALPADAPPAATDATTTTSSPQPEPPLGERLASAVLAAEKSLADGLKATDTARADLLTYLKAHGHDVVGPVLLAAGHIWHHDASGGIHRRPVAQ